MNYIQRLQEENRELRAKLECLKLEVGSFRAHLASEKFQGTEPDGSRKDWIATADVSQRLQQMEQWF